MTTKQIPNEQFLNMLLNSEDIQCVIAGEPVKATLKVNTEFWDEKRGTRTTFELSANDFHMRICTETENKTRLYCTKSVERLTAKSGVDNYFRIALYMNDKEQLYAVELLIKEGKYNNDATATNPANAFITDPQLFV